MVRLVREASWRSTPTDELASPSVVSGGSQAVAATPSLVLSEENVMTAEIRLSDPYTVPTRYWHRLDDGRLQCDVCPRACRLHEGQRGLCFVRGRIDDQRLRNDLCWFVFSTDE